MTGACRRREEGRGGQGGSRRSQGQGQEQEQSARKGKVRKGKSARHVEHPDKGQGLGELEVERHVMQHIPVQNIHIPTESVGQIKHTIEGSQSIALCKYSGSTCVFDMGSYLHTAVEPAPAAAALPSCNCDFLPTCLSLFLFWLLFIIKLSEASCI